MMFPLDFTDLSLFLAATSITLLVTSELLSPYYGKTNLKISTKRLKNAALATSILFLATVAVRIANIILNP